MLGSQCNATTAICTGNSFCCLYLLTYCAAVARSGRYLWLCSGYLYVANVVPSDDRHGYKYVCIVNNPDLGAHVQGQDQLVEPVEIQGTVDPNIQVRWSTVDS